MLFWAVIFIHCCQWVICQPDYRSIIVVFTHAEIFDCIYTMNDQFYSNTSKTWNYGGIYQSDIFLMHTTPHLLCIHSLTNNSRCLDHHEIMSLLHDKMYFVGISCQCCKKPLLLLRCYWPVIIHLRSHGLWYNTPVVLLGGLYIATKMLVRNSCFYLNMWRLWCGRYLHLTLTDPAATNLWAWGCLKLCLLVFFCKGNILLCSGKC